VEAFLLDEEHGAETAAGAEHAHAGIGNAELGFSDLRISQAVKIVAHLKRADTEAVAVRLDEMSPRVIDDVPIDAFLLDIVRHQFLREIVVIKLLAGFSLDVRPGGIHDLSGIRRQRVVAAGLHIGPLHALPRRFLQKDAAFMGHP
jgi:hypothetical protein